MRRHTIPKEWYRVSAGSGQEGLGLWGSGGLDLGGGRWTVEGPGASGGGYCGRELSSRGRTIWEGNDGDMGHGGIERWGWSMEQERKGRMDNEQGSGDLAWPIRTVGQGRLSSPHPAPRHQDAPDPAPVHELMALAIGFPIAVERLVVLLWNDLILWVLQARLLRLLGDQLARVLLGAPGDFDGERASLGRGQDAHLPPMLVHAKHHHIDAELLQQLLDAIVLCLEPRLEHPLAVIAHLPAEY